ncbi:hypothetical protein NUW58_g8833 [Xylaria curta]|uniref:Uncharacterized protein n=1 Tax=Xylaria curta TaxID=42375 RepID=A0ACC1N3K6_9PEZI|nr:hypothetical protein NUW58_g8833 [Xylaria curta]
MSFFFYSSFMLLGLFVFLRAIYYIGWSIHTYDLLYGGNKFDWARRLDDYTYTDDGTECWALVTNVGNGLGKRFAEELAALSFNVVLHDTSLAKAVALQTALQNKYPSHQFRTVVMDPSFHLNFKNGPSPNPICDKVRDITLKVLVNNNLPPSSTGLRCSRPS